VKLKSLQTVDKNVESEVAMVPNDTTEHQPVLSKTEARQGVTGNNVRYVLAASLFGAVLMFGLLLFFYN
jgi:hypothetical protein